jgi:DNA sulfur modification protein DndD
LGNSATELFAKLIDQEGGRVLQKIIVNSDYSLEILDKFGKRFLANISAGQRQIMSISFIAALAKAASNGNQINIPLFMDTPFGRLSYDHRKNLINEIPNLASQWILLATDTEFRREEAKILQGSGRWGKFYILQPNEEGNTIILEKELNSAISILQERSEENLA